MTLEILICSFNKGIVRIVDVLCPPTPNVRYIVSYQYTDERYLDLVPPECHERHDVTFYSYKGQGLSANRNLALEKATADLIMYADDDAHLSPETFEAAFDVFNANNELDVAFFRASTYTGKPLKNYPDEEYDIKKIPEDYSISAIEMVCRRTSVQGVIRYDERFGLGTKFLTCGEEEIWLEDALKKGLRMKYFPRKIVETSTMLKKQEIYIDAGVQRSYGAQTYYRHGSRAWIICLKFAMKSASQGYCHFWPMMKHLAEGINFMRRNK